MNYEKPPINKDLTINHFGQLVQWRDQPEIIDGWKCKIKSRFTIESVILFWAYNMEFTIAKNSFKGL